MLHAIAEQAARFPEFSIGGLDSRGLEGLDAAFAHAVYDAVLRRWLTLRWVVASRLKHPFEQLGPEVQAALLGGAAQLLLLDKVPPHAALDTSVEWVKGRAKKSVAGMVNGVLRNVARLVAGRTQRYSGGRDEVPLADGTAVKLREPMMPSPDLERVSVAASHPVGLLRRWGERYGADRARARAMHGLVSPPTVLNMRFAGDVDEPSLSWHEAPGHAVFRGPRAALVELLKRRPRVFVQDAAASGAVESVADLRPRVVADVCAGQGTKTRQLSMLFPAAEVIATDADESRLATLRASVGGNVRVVEFEGLERECAGRVDLVLLDVPCSNTGVLARRVEAKYRVGPEQMERLTAIQREILVLAEKLAAPGGVILYSTCSLEPEENEGQVRWMAGRGWRASKVRVELPTGLPGEAAERYRDGAFSAVLTRSN